MQMVPLQATARSKEDSASALRRKGLIPCVLYGNSIENTMLQCEERDMKRAYEKAGESTLVELAFEGKNIPVLIHELALDPVSDRFEHVDFFAVNMTKEVETHVPVHLLGEAPAVKNLGGILVTTLDHVTVRCLPSKLPHELTADMGTMEEFHSTLTVADISLPDGVTILDESDAVIAIVQEPRKEEVEVPAAPADGADGAAPAAAEGAASAEAEKKEE